MTYAFRAATAADLPLINAWKAEPHVAAWWDDEPIDSGDLEEPGYRLWIVSLDGRPFAMLQDYRIHDHPGHHLAMLPEGALGIDLFIGPPDMVDKGHGPSLIRAYCDTQFATGIPAIGTDPHPDNARAIAAFARAGFEVVGDAVETPWGRSLPMGITLLLSPLASGERVG